MATRRSVRKRKENPRYPGSSQHFLGGVEGEEEDDDPPEPEEGTHNNNILGNPDGGGVPASAPTFPILNLEGDFDWSEEVEHEDMVRRLQRLRPQPPRNRRNRRLEQQEQEWRDEQERGGDDSDKEFDEEKENKDEEDEVQGDEDEDQVHAYEEDEDQEDEEEEDEDQEDDPEDDQEDDDNDDELVDLENNAPPSPDEGIRASRIQGGVLSPVSSPRVTPPAPAITSPTLSIQSVSLLAQAEQEVQSQRQESTTSAPGQEYGGWEEDHDDHDEDEEDYDEEMESRLRRLRSQSPVTPSGPALFLQSVNQDQASPEEEPPTQEQEEEQNEIDDEENPDNDDNEDDEEELLFHLAGRDLPNLPQPVPGAGDEDGWEAISRLGALDSFLVKFPMLKDIPEQHKGHFAKAFTHILQKWDEASTEEGVTLALLWLGFLPQALQRKPTRGGKVGRAQVAHRYNSCIIGDWGEVVKLWERDNEKREEGREERRRELTEGEEITRTRREVLGEFAEGRVGKGMSRIRGHGVADSHDPAVKEQLQRKFLPRHQALPDTVLQLSPIDSFLGLKESLLSLEPGKSPGSGGMRPEYLIALGERLEGPELALLEKFGLAYTAGKLPAWFYRLWLSLMTVPLYKSGAKTDCRPLGIQHTIPRLFHSQVALQTKPEVREFLEPQQLGQSQAGAAKLVFSTSGMLELRQDNCCFGLDLENFHNTLGQRSILDVITTTPELAHLQTLAAAVCSPVVALESGGRVWGSMGDGRPQGDPLSSSFGRCWHWIDRLCGPLSTSQSSSSFSMSCR